MAIMPNSTIYLCCVPFDSTNKNQIYFDTNASSLQTQLEYFQRLVKKTFTEFTPVRKTQPNGGVISSIKVEMNIDEFYSKGINYMFYQNANHGLRYYFAFITKAIYINEETTELIFETDAFQTWLHDITIRPSFVVREHSETDEIGDNVVPESFHFENYIYYEVFDGAVLPKDETLDKWGYLLGSAEALTDTTPRGVYHSGIYQGMYFYYFKTATEINTFLNTIESNESTPVEFITAIPQFIIPANKVSEDGHLFESDSPTTKEYDILVRIGAYTIDGYTPKNKKLYTNPFFNLVVNNHAGDEAVYNLEEFEKDDDDNIQFMMKGDISTSPSLTLYPRRYQHLTNNYDAGISISGFPQCAVNSDTFKIWLSKNAGTFALSTLGSAGTLAGGIATAIGTGGTSLAISGGAIVGGAMGLLSNIDTFVKASKEPNRVSGGGAKNNLLTAMKMNKFSFYWRMIKREHAETVDNFFTLYGYQTNKLKQPNCNSRPCWNYVQTNNVNITGDIPNEDMIAIKNMFNSGVTFWNPWSTMFDYTQNNAPAEG